MSRKGGNGGGYGGYGNNWSQQSSDSGYGYSQQSGSSGGGGGGGYGHGYGGGQQGGSSGGYDGGYGGSQQGGSSGGYSKGGGGGGGHQQYWESTMSSNIPPQSGNRSSYHMHVAPQQLEQTWARVGDLTSRDGLGYMTSRSPGIMHGGDHAGKYTISVHHDDANAGRVGDAIERAGLGEQVFKHSPIVPRQPGDQ